ncbi:methyltransferase domain-containing protein [Kriegella sp. EG-1]|nr:methyltransferase domain-containing protein [Flavobacteriaceae bacterium EG-1]
MDFEIIAKQLANPSGEFGIDVAKGMNKMNRFISKSTYDLLHIKNRDAVLEIGLGNGKFIDYIIAQANQISYTGIDISETMIAEAKRINRNLINKKAIDLFHADIEKIPVWDETFHKVCTVNTIYFWKNPVKALKEIYRVLKPNGILIVSFRPYIEGQTLDFSNYGFKEYRSEDFNLVIQETSFKLIEIINKKEPEVLFNGQTHHLTSQYFIIKKLPLNWY